MTTHHDDALRTTLAGLLPRLRRHARMLTGDPHDADDVVQVALERALARASQLQPGASVEGWVFAILRNAWIDEQRTRGRRHADGDDALAAIADTAPAPGVRLDVESALARLPEAQRDVVALVWVEGLAYREAAEVLDVPIGTVTSRLARARDALQVMLGGNEGG